MCSGFLVKPESPVTGRASIAFMNHLKAGKDAEENKKEHGLGAGTAVGPGPLEEPRSRLCSDFHFCETEEVGVGNL